MGEKKDLLNSPQLGRKSAKSSAPSNAPLHYAIIVDEVKLRVREVVLVRLQLPYCYLPLVLIGVFIVCEYSLIVFVSRLHKRSLCKNNNNVQTSGTLNSSSAVKASKSATQITSLHIMGCQHSIVLVVMPYQFYTY